ncbi:hypothetical protein GCM10009682_63060 [Luedemannella flava]|uniref:Plasmid replication, integration and excision activator n=1 Tax=Luedemannella flava TaxID=349316 RepID=A0ABP4Z0M9_9ACTN
MVPSSFKVPVPFGYAFPRGALGLSVDKKVDFSKRGQADDQERDKDTGERVWVVEVMDLDPMAAKFRRDRVKVKIIAPHQPVLPASKVPGYPPAIEFVGLVLVPWVDDSRCKGAGDCKARMAFSMRAEDIAEVSASVVDSAA